MVQARACKALYSGSIPLAASSVLAGQGPSAKSGGSFKRSARRGNDAKFWGPHRSDRSWLPYGFSGGRTVERREWGVRTDHFGSAVRPGRGGLCGKRRESALHALSHDVGVRCGQTRYQVRLPAAGYARPVRP